MALVSAMRGPISQRIAALDPLRSEFALPLLWAGFLTLLVAAPWLEPGYLFGTDWVGPRRIPFPTDLASFAPLQAALAAASAAIGGEATGKLFVFGILFTAAALSYRAAPAAGFVPRAVAATIYLVNPFVYGRLHYGQLFLLAGYSVLPWVAVRLRQLLIEPGAVTGIMSAASLTLLGVLSLHLALASTVLATALVVAHLVAAQVRLAYLKRLVLPLLLATAAASGASSYWIVPLLRGIGWEGSLLSGIGSGDLRAFAAIPDQTWGLLPNLLGLYGFWAEASGRFTSMKAFVPAWPAILGLLLILCGFGAFAALRKRDKHLTPWVAGLLATATLAVILEMGVSHPWTGGLVGWLDAHIPPYRGMRDAGKWAALLALAYSQLAGLGAAAALGWLRKRGSGSHRSEWLVSIGAAVLLALPLYYGNGLLYGAHGEIKPSQYPAGWYAADRVLASDGHPGRTLFLPWHLYLRLSFVRNQNSVVASPASSFFSTPVLVSSDPEVPGIVPPADSDQVAVSILVKAGDRGPWAQVLAAHGIKYVLVAREVDWSSYRYLENQAGLVRVGDYGSIVLYRNMLVT
jgi:hypothetical protein